MHRLKYDGHPGAASCSSRLQGKHQNKKGTEALSFCSEVWLEGVNRVSVLRHG